MVSDVNLHPYTEEKGGAAIYWVHDEPLLNYLGKAEEEVQQVDPISRLLTPCIHSKALSCFNSLKKVQCFQKAIGVSKLTYTCLHPPLHVGVSPAGKKFEPTLYKREKLLERVEVGWGGGGGASFTPGFC